VRRWMSTWSKFWKVTPATRTCAEFATHKLASDPAKTYVNRPDLIRTEAWRGLWTAPAYGLSFDLQLYPAQMADAAALAHAALTS
jgi:predicted TIM-barrel fold metal-dependent hydrolase